MCALLAASHRAFGRAGCVLSVKLVTVVVGGVLTRPRGQQHNAHSTCERHRMGITSRSFPRLHVATNTECLEGAAPGCSSICVQPRLLDSGQDAWHVWLAVDQSFEFTIATRALVGWHLAMFQLLDQGQRLAKYEVLRASGIFHCR